MPVTKWLGGTPAPDLSNVLKLAGQVGRMEGKSQFQEQFLQYKQGEINKANTKAASEAKKAADDEGTKALGEEPESDGFWSNVGQAVMAIPGLEQTVDVLSRFNYASANAALYSAKQDVKAGDVSWLQDIQNDIQNMPEMLKAGWEGFKNDGKKTTFSEVIKYTAKHDGKDNWKDNKWTQGIGGFAGDVLLDPTTYLGVGLITKPLQLAKVGKIDKTLSNDLARELSRNGGTPNLRNALGLPQRIDNVGDTVQVTGDEIYSIIGGARGFAVPESFNGVKLTRRQQKVYRRTHTVKGAHHVGQAEKIAGVRRRMEGLEVINKVLRDSPFVHTDSALAVIRKTIADTEAEMGRAVSSYGNKHYIDVRAEAGAKFDAEMAGNVPHRIPVGTQAVKSVEQELTDLVTINKLVVGFQAQFFIKNNYGTAAQRTINEGQEAAAFGWTNSPKFSDDFRANHVKAMHTDLNGNKAYTDNEDRIIVLAKSRDKAVAESNANPGSEALQAAKRSHKNALKEAYLTRAQLKGETMFRLMAEDANRKSMGSHPDFSEEFAELDIRLDQVKAQMKILRKNDSKSHVIVDTGDRPQELKSLLDNNSTAGDEGTKIDGIRNEDVDEYGTISETSNGAQDEMRGLSQERRAIEDEMAALEDKYIRENPDDALYNSKVTGTLDGDDNYVPGGPMISRPTGTATTEEHAAWDLNVVDNIKMRTDQIWKQLFKTAQRKERAGGKPAKAKKGTPLYAMTDGNPDGILRIKLGNKSATYTEAKAELKGLATVADRKKAAQLSSLADKDNVWTVETTTVRGKKVKTYTRPVGNMRGLSRDVQDALPSGIYIRGKTIVVADGHLGVQIPLEKVVFDRRFKKQHGMSHYDASQLKAVEEGRFITGTRGEKLTKPQYVDAVYRDPDEYSVTNRYGMTLPKEAYPDEIAKRVGQSGFGFRKFAAAVHRDFDDADSILTMKERDAAVLELWQSTFKEFMDNPRLFEEQTTMLNNSFEWRKNQDLNLKEKKLKDVETALQNKVVGKSERQDIHDKAEEMAIAEVNAKNRLPDLSDEATGHKIKPPKAEPKTTPKTNDELVEDYNTSVQAHYEANPESTLYDDNMIAFDKELAEYRRVSALDNVSPAKMSNVFDRVKKAYHKLGLKEPKVASKSAPEASKAVDDLAEIQLEELHKLDVDKARSDYVNGVSAAKAAENAGSLGPEGSRLASELRKLEGIRDERLARANKAFEEANLTRESIAKRVDEQILIDILKDTVNQGSRQIRFKMGTGSTPLVLDVPLPLFMIKATEQLGHVKLISAMGKVWSQAFNPASRLEPELNAARLDAQAGTPRIIKYHLKKIKRNFSKYKEADRANAFRLVAKGSPPVGDQTLYKNMEDFFTEFSDHTSGKTIIGGEALTIRELNHYLADDYHFVDPRDGNVNDMILYNGQEIIEAMRNLPPNADPMRVMWTLSVAAEQAIAYKALKHTITETFGIQRAFSEVDMKFAAKGTKAAEQEGMTKERAKLVESLQKEHGWRTVRDMGGKHYFPPEVIEEIETLLRMMQPENVASIVKLYDKVIGNWKAAVTVYNPGYYTRNGIGETIMGLMDGVGNPIHYSRAAKIMSYIKPDEVKEALRSLHPWQKRFTPKQKGARIAATLPNGTKITFDEIHMLYVQSNLKTGFVSSEYDHLFPTGSSLRSNTVGKAATRINDGVRAAGEAYEDYFRMAHFISRLERAPKTSIKTGKKTTPEEAASYAADFVRKYHFDYTDFSKFEKSTMMRIFPFYKWTRKSFPLMAGMLFTNPGKAMLYPKAMHNLSVATGGNEGNDTNGILPNYEAITPEWMKNMFTYPIGRDGEENMDYMNIANPQFDIYKMMRSPINASLGLLSPAIKQTLEQTTGGTLSEDNPVRFDEVEGSRTKAMMGVTPATSLINKWQDNQGVDGNGDAYDSAIKEPGVPMDETLTSFLTGLGFYENNKRRQMGETFRQNIAKSKE